MDKILVYYSIGRKTIKEYKRLLWRIIDLTLVNAFVLYFLGYPESKMKQKVFWLQLADDILEELLVLKLM